MPFRLFKPLFQMNGFFCSARFQIISYNCIILRFTGIKWPSLVAIINSTCNNSLLPCASLADGPPLVPGPGTRPRPLPLRPALPPCHRGLCLHSWLSPPSPGCALPQGPAPPAPGCRHPAPGCPLSFPLLVPSLPLAHGVQSECPESLSRGGPVWDKPVKRAVGRPGHGVGAGEVSSSAEAAAGGLPSGGVGVDTPLPAPAPQGSWVPPHTAGVEQVSQVPPAGCSPEHLWQTSRGGRSSSCSCPSTHSPSAGGLVGRQTQLSRGSR